MKSVTPARKKSDSLIVAFKIALIIPPLKVIFKFLITSFFFFFFFNAKAAGDTRVLTFKVGSGPFSSLWTHVCTKQLCFI